MRYLSSSSSPIALLLLLGSCQSEPEKSDYISEPFWQATPNIEKHPKNFCDRVKVVFGTLPRAKNFRCQEKIQASLGARVDVDEVQIVLIKGAENKWFMQAYQIEKRANIGSTSELINIQKKLEENLM